MPYIVIDRKRVKVTAENSKHRITRNVSHFKRANADISSQYHCSDSESEFERDNDNHELNVEQEDVNNCESLNAPNGRSIRNHQAPICYGEPIPSD